MGNQSGENRFARFFLWMAEAKATMGLFFIFFVFIYLLLGLVSEGPAVAVDFFLALEIGVAGFVIGLSHQILLAGDRLSRLREALWVAVSMGVTLAFSVGFGWFTGFPLWCSIVFLLVTAVGLCTMVFRQHLMLKRDTKRLNEQLAQYQKQGR